MKSGWGEICGGAGGEGVCCPRAGGQRPKKQVAIDACQQVGNAVADFQHVDDVLEQAPLMEGWTVSTREALSLHGQVLGHPELGDRRIASSELWVMAPHDHWCRTYSRFYRLGSPLVPTEGIVAKRWN